MFSKLALNLLSLIMILVGVIGVSVAVNYYKFALAAALLIVGLDIRYKYSGVKRKGGKKR